MRSLDMIEKKYLDLKKGLKTAKVIVLEFSHVQGVH